MSTFCVLQILLSTLIWYQNKSWSIHGGEEHAKRWHSFDFVLTINLAPRRTPWVRGYASWRPCSWAPPPWLDMRPGLTRVEAELPQMSLTPSLLPLMLDHAFPRSLATAERSRHGRRARSTAVPPCLCAPPLPVDRGTSFLSSCRTSGPPRQAPMAAASAHRPRRLSRSEPRARPPPLLCRREEGEEGPHMGKESFLGG